MSKISKCVISIFMDGVKLPAFLLIIVLVLGFFLFDPFSEKKPSSARKKTQQQTGTTVKSSKTPEQAITDAQKALKEGNFEEVASLLEPHANNDEYEIQRMLGYAYSGIKKFDSAILAFEKSLEKRKLPENGYSLAYLYEITGRLTVARMLYEDLLSARLPPKLQRAVYEGLARTTVFDNDTRLAWKYNAELIKKYPDSSEGFVALVKIIKQAGNTKDLEKLVSVGDRFHKNNFEYNFWLGTLYYEMGKFDSALERFKSCIRITPDNSTPYYYTYQILKRQKNIEQALVELEKYHRLNPLLPHIFFEAALDAKNEGKIELAYRFIRSALTMDRTLLGRNDKGTMKAIERMVKASGNDLQKNFLSAFINYINGDYAIAREQITHIQSDLKGTPLEDDARRIIRECDILAMQDARYASHVRELQRQKEMEQAAQLQAMATDPAMGQETEVDVIRRKAMINPNDLRLQYSAGLQLAKLGYIEDAKQFLDNAIRINPNLMEPNYSMAKLLIHQENFSQARSYIDRALNINPNSSQTLSVSAMLHLNNNDFSRAQGDALAALKANPNNGEARLILAQVYARNQDRKQAMQQINMGLEVEKDPQKREQLMRLKNNLAN